MSGRIKRKEEEEAERKRAGDKRRRSAKTKMHGWEEDVCKVEIVSSY